MRVLIVIPFFGTTPPWIDYFIKSCSKNSNYHWLLYGNLEIVPVSYTNILIVKSTIEEFNELASSKLGFSISLDNPYKLCDFKPAFGKIFSDYFYDYDFWGYCDLDLIFGNIESFIRPDILKTNDIITTKVNYISGHFSLFRNNDTTKNLYKKIWNIKYILKDHKKHYAIDELSNLIGRKLLTSSQEKNILKKLSEKVINSLKYRVYKKLPLLYDFTKVICQSEKEATLKVLHLDCVKSDYFYMKQNQNDWNVKWNEGELYDQKSKKNIMYFHFFMSKRTASFTILPFRDQSSFTISETGISS